MCRITYHRRVVEEDIPRLSFLWREKIKRAIEEKLTVHPDLYGKPLRRSMKGYRKLRVGDYRVIFKITRQTVKVLIIAHRSAVYKLANSR